MPVSELVSVSEVMILSESMSEFVYGVPENLVSVSESGSEVKIFHDSESVFKTFELRRSLSRINEHREEILKTKEEYDLGKRNLPRSNLPRKTKIEDEFEETLKIEVSKLESKMKIGYSTLRRLAMKIRSRQFGQDEKLKNLKFSKPYLKRFVSEKKLMFTKRKSNQIKFSEKELKELRKPIDQFLFEKGFKKDRCFNLGRVDTFIFFLYYVSR